jgi:D-glycero-D-manno-heptose 1,7-bisphosphate phosphatase
MAADDGGDGVAVMRRLHRGTRRRAVFLDKDGTLIDDLPYNVDPARMRLARGAAQGLRRLAGCDFLLFVVSNQSGVALGHFSEPDLGPVQDWLSQRFREQGAALAEFRYCPHAPALDGTPTCDCRKPRPGMLLDLADRYGLDLSASWMIGDILDDIEAAHRAGCRAILIDNGNETLWRKAPHREPDGLAADVADAVRRICDQPIEESA